MSNLENLLPPLSFAMPNWDARWPKAKLVEQYYEITAGPFDRGYRQRPQSSADLLFPNLKFGEVYAYGEDWRKISDEDLRDKETGIHPNVGEPGYVDPSWPRFTGVDLSGRGRRGNVIFTIAMSPDEVRHVVDVRMGAWSAPDMARQIDEVAREHHPLAIFVENNGYQNALIEMIRDMELSCAGLVNGFHTGQNKMKPDIGLPSIDVQFSQGLWRISIPHDEDEYDQRSPNAQGCVCPVCTFVRDAKTLTFEDLKVTPDTVMACWISKEASRLGGRWTIESVKVVKVDNRPALERARRNGSVYRIPSGQTAGVGRKKAKTDAWGRPVDEYKQIQARREAAEREAARAAAN